MIAYGVSLNSKTKHQAQFKAIKFSLRSTGRGPTPFVSINFWGDKIGGPYTTKNVNSDPISSPRSLFIFRLFIQPLFRHSQNKYGENMIKAIENVSSRWLLFTEDRLSVLLYVAFVLLKPRRGILHNLSSNH